MECTPLRLFEEPYSACKPFPRLTVPLLHVELYMEFLNSRISPHSLHVPALIGPFGLSMTQKCTHEIMWTPW